MIAKTMKIPVICFLFVILVSILALPAAGETGQTGDFEITNPMFGDEVIADSGLIIRWSSSADADGYWIALRDLTTNDKILDNIDIGKKKSYKITDLEPGHSYRVAVCAYGDGLESTWKECEFSVAEAELEPEIISLSVSPSEGMTNTDYFTFTIKTNAYVDEVSVEIDGYSIGTIAKFKGSSTRTFTLSDITLSSPGINREVVAYAYGTNGDVVTKSTTITVIATEPVGTPTILSPSDGSTHSLGESLSVSWSAPSTNPTDYNVYLYYNGAVVFSKKEHSSTSLTIPSGNIQSVGTYSLEVYANKKGYSADDPGNVFIRIVEAEKPTPTPQKPVTQETVKPTPTPTPQKPVAQETVKPTPTPTPTPQKPITQETVKPTPTPTPTPQKPITQETVKPTQSGAISNPLGASVSKNPIINKVKVDINKGFLFFSKPDGKYTVTVETNRDVEKVVLSIPEKNIHNVVLGNGKDKWFFGDYREFTWTPTNENHLWLYKGKTYTIKVSVYNGGYINSGTEKSNTVKGTQPENGKSSAEEIGEKLSNYASDVAEKMEWQTLYQ